MGGELGEMEMRIPANPEILKTISRIDQFRSFWAGGTSVAPEQLARMRETARVHSVGSSCRIAGIRVSETDVVAVLAGVQSPIPESAELVGYAAAMDRSFPASGPIVTVEELAALNAVVMGKPIASDVFSLKVRGESTRNGWTSRISRPTCGLQSIQMMSCRSGTHT